MTSTPVESVDPAPGRWKRILLHLLFAAIGVAAMVALVQHVGALELQAILVTAAPWLPLLIAFEAGRMACEVLSTWWLYNRAPRPSAHTPERAVRHVPIGAVAHAQVAAYAVFVLMPAGRAAGEALKARELSAITGTPRAAAVATMNQAMSLLAGGVVSIVCLAASLAVTGVSVLSTAILIHGLVSGGSGAAIQLASRRREIGGLLKRFARAGQATAEYQNAVRAHPMLPRVPLATLTLSRAIQVLQFAVLIAVVGGAFGLLPALLASAVNLVGASAGDLVPGQIGATDGAFALAAPLLGLSDERAVAIPVLVHFVQVAAALASSVVPALWRGPLATAASTSPQ